MIGAGAVATRLLAGAWFGFDLLWVALYVIPMVIFTLDSASRVAILSGGRGMLEMVRARHRRVARLGDLPRRRSLVNVVVNMSQMSAMVEGAYGALRPAAARRIRVGVGLVIVTVALTALTVVAAVLGGYKRVEKIMTGLLLVILVCFIVVAIKGLLDWHTWLALGAGLVPNDPRERAGRRRDRASRNGFTQMMAIAGQALPPAVFLSYGYLAANAGYTVRDVGRAFWKTVQNLGVIWGLFSVVVIVAGATALHAVYDGSWSRRYLGVSHYSQIESIPVAGQVLGPALPGRARLPGAALLLARAHRRGVHHADLRVADDDLLLPRHRAARLALHEAEHARSRWSFAVWIAVPALVAPFWQLPALLKAILAMVGNLLLAPVAVAVILYFVNRPRMGEFKANTGRNVVLVITGLFALALVINGVRDFLR